MIVWTNSPLLLTYLRKWSSHDGENMSQDYRMEKFSLQVFEKGNWFLAPTFKTGDWGFMKEENISSETRSVRSSKSLTEPITQNPSNLPQSFITESCVAKTQNLTSKWNMVAETMCQSWKFVLRLYKDQISTKSNSLSASFEVWTLFTFKLVIKLLLLNSTYLKTIVRMTSTYVKMNPFSNI